jgi:DNA-binding XRE family transcriptional regulator
MIQFDQYGVKLITVNDLGKLRQASKWGYLRHMINPAQCKMARAALGWSTRELAKRARVGSNTVARFENGKPANVSTVTLIQQAFEAAGIEFTNGEAPGVRLHPRKE